MSTSSPSLLSSPPTTQMRASAAEDPISSLLPSFSRPRLFLGSAGGAARLCFPKPAPLPLSSTRLGVIVFANLVSRIAQLNIPMQPVRRLPAGSLEERGSLRAEPVLPLQRSHLLRHRGSTRPVPLSTQIGAGVPTTNARIGPNHFDEAFPRRSDSCCSYRRDGGSDGALPMELEVTQQG